MAPRPVFVVSAPRSGSTMVVALLDSHPRTLMTNEAAWVTFLRKMQLLASTPAMRTIDDGEGFCTAGILPERYVPAFAESFAQVARPFVLELLTQAVGARDYAWFGDKVMSLNDLAFAIDQFPDASFLHLVRDPRDAIASSYAFQAKQPASWQDATFEQRVVHIDAFLRESAQLLRGARTPEVRYEDIVADPEHSANDMFGFLGLTVTEEVSTFLGGSAHALFERHGTSVTGEASVGRWRRDLSPAQQDAVNAALAEHLRRYGYA